MLARLPLPAIVQVEDRRDSALPPHLLVVLRATADGVYILDAPFPVYFLPWSEFESCWTGRVLVLVGSQAEADEVERLLVTKRLVPPLAWVGLACSAVIPSLMFRRQLSTRAREFAGALRHRRVVRASLLFLIPALVIGLAVALSGKRLFQRATASIE